MRGSARRQSPDLYLLDRRKRRVPLVRWDTVAPPDALFGSPVPRSLRAFFQIGERAARARRLDAPAPAAFLELSSGLVRIVDRELVLRFLPGTPERRRRSLLRAHGFRVLRVNRFAADQWTVHAPDRGYPGEALLEIANLWAEQDEVVFAAPNFLSLPRREAVPSVLPEEWHLSNRGGGGAKAGEDLKILQAWERTTGRREIVVAVLDDGVDLAHPNLRRNLWRNPDPKALDRRGRDFFLPESHPGHFDPRPKRFLFPFEQVSANDIHGTPCAGLIAAGGIGLGSTGVAPRCRILPVKIFHADDLVQDELLANAIRWAGRHADILSCSWSSGVSPDVELALEDAAASRAGRGAAVFCSAGNGFGLPVSFPARSPHAIAVGASTDRGERAAYSSCGPELAFLAPSSGGTRGLFTTDVSQPGLGLEPGSLHTHRFGGTSAAAALAAGVGALVLSVDPDLDRTGLKDLLAGTADEIPGGIRLNAASAVEEAARRERKG
jgi:subtilisin family serine protease